MEAADVSAPERHIRRAVENLFRWMVEQVDAL
jgi:hypothetical protein